MYIVLFGNRIYKLQSASVITELSVFGRSLGKAESSTDF